MSIGFSLKKKTFRNWKKHSSCSKLRSKWVLEYPRSSPALSCTSSGPLSRSLHLSEPQFCVCSFLSLLALCPYPRVRHLSPKLHGNTNYNHSFFLLSKPSLSSLCEALSLYYFILPSKQAYRMGIFIPVYRLYCQLMVELGYGPVQITITTSASSPGSLTPHQAPVAHHMAFVTLYCSAPLSGSPLLSSSAWHWRPVSLHPAYLSYSSDTLYTVARTSPSPICCEREFFLLLICPHLLFT